MITHYLLRIKGGNMSGQLLFLMRLQIALYCAFLAIWLPSGGQSSRVEFYNQSEYHEFLAERVLDLDSAGECFSIEDTLFGSIKTDRCLMFYSREDCQVDNDRKYPDPDIAQTYKVFQNEPILRFDLEQYMWPRQDARSFQLCSQENGGGPQVDVQFYEKPYMGGRVLQEYKNLCGCRNIPLSLYLGKANDFSIDNHGNGVELFSQEYCKGDQVEVPAGRNHFSLVAPTNNQFNVRSIRPVNGHDCMKLKAIITKFYFANETQNHLPQKIKFAASTKVRNNGASKISQEYSLSERVVDTLDMTLADAFMQMNNVDTSAKLETELDIGFPIFGKSHSEFKAGLGYAFSKSDTTSRSSRVVNTTERTVSTKQSVDIPECKECILTDFLRKMVNFPFRYVAYARVSGTGAGVPLTAEEVRQNLPDGAIYIKDYDHSTVEIKANGNMKADYGIDAFIEVNCQPIPGCGGGENGLYSKKKLNYEIPIPIN